MVYKYVNVHIYTVIVLCALKQAFVCIGDPSGLWLPLWKPALWPAVVLPDAAQVSDTLSTQQLTAVNCQGLFDYILQLCVIL